MLQATFKCTISIAIGGSTPKKKLYDRVSKDAFERLELSEGKLARSVLRGLGAGNCAWLPYNRYAKDFSWLPCYFESLLRTSSRATVDGWTLNRRAESAAVF